MKANNSNTKPAVIDPALSENDLCIEVAVRLWGRHEEILNIKPRMTYPLGLHPSLSPATANNVAKILEVLVMQPVNVILNDRESQIFEEETRRTEERINSSGGKKTTAPFASGQGTDFPFISPDFTDPMDEVAQMPVETEEEAAARLRAA